MTEWAKTKLGEVTTKIGSGATPLGGDEVYRVSGISFIRSLNIYDDGFQLKNLAKIDETQAKRLSNVAVEQGDVLLNITGASVARCCVVPAELLPARVNQHVCILRPKTQKLDPRFLHRLLTSTDYKDRLLRIGQSGGATRQAITKSQLEEFEIEYPVSLPEQQRIAKLLDAADALRARRRAALAQLDTLTQSIFLDMFGNPVQNPFGFPLVQLDSVIASGFQNGAYFPKEAYSANGGVEMVHMSDAFEGIVKRGALRRVSCTPQDVRKYGISSTDLLVARRSLNYSGSVKPCLVPTSNEPLIFESSLIRIRPNTERIGVQFLFHYLSNQGVRERYVLPYVTQATISGINQGNLALVLVLCPPVALQESFARRVAAVDKLKSAHRASLAELDALFASLQHRAFRGEL